ncbi:alpha/beta hydrolase [Caulobacter flavus]|uniref:Alpha/beta hydrolase n=1 Tax=Caulobacter flavus TaxID=1679497 RepID=A0A2N5CX30_9CAUL|nr:alpha/beta hydrolase [Caulobacter flavus]AYV47529.1 alpha/beta hydrolase [Caulobacter flavus]PLR18371.1 alpha/beta hydrolase [Caulobacter flavus]
MPLILLARWLFSLLSLAILAAASYLLWSWWNGAVVIDAQGLAHRLREPWRLWTGLGLLAWSLLGRWPTTWILTKPDTERTRPVRERSHMIQSPTGSRLYVEVHGPTDAPPVILTHGWGLDSTIWFVLRRHLERRFKVIVWDLPGLGRSRAASGQAVDLSHFARDLQAVLALADGRPAVLVGHSIGGMTIQTLARDWSELSDTVAGVVLVNTTYTNPLRTMALGSLAQALRLPLLEPMLRLTIWLQPLAWLSAWQSYLSGAAHMANRIGFSRHVTRSQLEHTTLLATRNSPAASARGNLAMFGWDADGALQAVGRQTLILAGDQDLVTKCEASQALAEATPGARLEIVAKANHMGFLERAERYTPMIEGFCDSVLFPRASSQRAPTPTQA